MSRRPGKPTLVLLGGQLHGFPIDPDAWESIIAADHGAAHALRQGVLPHCVVGDFDSLDKEDQARLCQAAVPVVRLPTAKDLTDGEAAVRLALERGARTLVLAGGIGDRFDHTLGNILLLHLIAEAGAYGWVTDGRQQVYLLRETLTIEGTPGDQLSIIPLTATVDGVHIWGVRWPLHGETLHFSSTRSLSNELTAARVALRVSAGMALVVITKAL